jgi:hypothetical protein
MKIVKRILVWLADRRRTKAERKQAKEKQYLRSLDIAGW